MIVVDVGSATHGGDTSIPHLVREFKPDFLYGFDPAEPDDSYSLDGTLVTLRQAAAWTYDGTIGFQVAGLGGHVQERHKITFPCVDLAAFILSLPEDDIVLKMDAEGAEYVVLPHLVANDADLRLKIALLEWHCEMCGLGGNGRHRERCRMDRDKWIARRESVESAMRCETAEWNL